MDADGSGSIEWRELQSFLNVNFAPARFTGHLARLILRAFSPVQFGGVDHDHLKYGDFAKMYNWLAARKRTYVEFLAARPGAMLASFEQIAAEVRKDVGDAFTPITLEYMLDTVRPEAEDLAPGVECARYLSLMASLKAMERLAVGGSAGEPLVRPVAGTDRFSLTVADLGAAVFFCA